MKIPVIETARLRLRGWRQQDLDAFAAMNADENFMRYIGIGQPLNRSDSWRSMAAFLGHWHLKGFGLWLVETKNTGEFVGRIGLYEPEGWPGIELGWGISPKHWGKGYATEGASAALHWGFKNLAIEQLISIIHPQNDASIKVAKRLGESFNRNALVNSIECSIYAITKDTFDKTNCGKSADFHMV